MRNLFLFALLLIVIQVPAQKSKFGLQTLVQGGLLEGETGSAFQLQAINGVRHKTWAAGVGAGLDYYHARSVPLFLNLRKTFGSGKAPFLYVSGGYNFPWLRVQDKEWNYQSAKTGLYYDAGIGYQLPVLKNSALLFSAGYSVKEYSTKAYSDVVIAIYPSPPSDARTFDYTLRRISIKAGLRF